MQWLTSAQPSTTLFAGTVLPRGQRTQLASRDTIPASVRGWNTRDALAAMKPEYATILDNYFPELGQVRLRRGAQPVRDTGSGEAVETLISHRSGTTRKIFAASGGNLYDITTANAITTVKDSLTSNRWQSGMFGGQTIMVNGADDPMRIEAVGTLATAHGWTGTGLNPANLIQVLPFKARVFFLEKDTANLWYGPIAGVQGELTKFPLDQVYPAGGNAAAMGSLTMDAGDGADDFFVVMMEDGGTLVYQGIDIGLDGGWYKRGTYMIGAPVGDRPLIQRGADLLAITTDGYVSLAPYLLGGASRSEVVPLSDKIAPSVSQAVRLFGENFGWQAILYTPANWLLFNVPSGASTVQHVMNTQTGAWGRFTGWNAHCWLVHRNKLYYGSDDGLVYQADTGHQDGDAGIMGDVQSAYRYIKGRGSKRCTCMRPIVEADATAELSVGLGVDFEPEAALTATASIVAPGSTWAGLTWDNFTWAPGLKQIKEWHTINRDGTAVAVRLRTNTRGARVSLYTTEIMALPMSGIGG